MTEEYVEKMANAYFDILQIASDFFRKKNLIKSYHITKKLMSDIYHYKDVCRIIRNGLCKDTDDLLKYIYLYREIDFEDLKFLQRELEKRNFYNIIKETI